MKPVVKSMIKKYALLKLKYDFMGYTFQNIHELSFHHLIIPANICTSNNDRGYLEWNGSILVQNSHNYLHIIELYDLDRFYEITSELIDIIVKGYLDIESLRNIDDILCSFEYEYIGKKKENGNFIIKEEYLDRIQKKSK